MKTLIIYKSYHKLNTEKIAKVMVEAMNAKLVKVEDVKSEDLAKYDLIGFGSGIYASKFHKKIYEFIGKMSSMNKNVFIFCTSASGKFGEKDLIKEKLSEQGCKVIGEFNCFAEFRPLCLKLGKMGHPDAKDLEDARKFGKGLLDL
jgi:flavodoxin